MMIIDKRQIIRHIRYDGKITVRTTRGKDGDNNPIAISQPVFCFHANTGELLGKKWSDKDGYVTFENLIKGVKYMVVGVDRVTDGVQDRLVGQDLITAE